MAVGGSSSSATPVATTVTSNSDGNCLVENISASSTMTLREDLGQEKPGAGSEQSSGLANKDPQICLTGRATLNPATIAIDPTSFTMISATPSSSSMTSESGSVPLPSSVGGIKSGGGGTRFDVVTIEAAAQHRELSNLSPQTPNCGSGSQKSVLCSSSHITSQI
ncbi:unnamed protein product [Protopolystoma xenopodis]|uniref:Uncharacterized protein n=1 Tax=Protopolystoma xenopodis TaxID=117903 RepID=A0A448XAG1_9PLAT|nr:unnamed protein product [Protopolystoma xenopodis]